MGTNYHARLNVCAACGRSDELHIGKSSAGWCFALRIYPDREINDLDDWRAIFKTAEIRDEYDKPVTAAQMLIVITDRSFAGEWNDQSLRANYAKRGPSGLARHVAGIGVCVGHGVGTWDLMDGEFS